MNEKIKAALLAKYKSLGFDGKVIDAMVAYLAVTVTDENQIEAAVTAVEPIMKANQAEIDRRVTAVKAEAGKSGQNGGGAAQGGSDKGTEPGDNGNANEVPAWAQTIIDQNKSLASEVAMLKNDKSTATRMGKLEAKLENASDAFKKTTLNAFKRMSFDKDEDFDAYLQEVEEDAKAFVQTEADRKLGAQGKPALPAGGSGTEVKPATKEELDTMMKSL